MESEIYFDSSWYFVYILWYLQNNVTRKTISKLAARWPKFHCDSYSSRIGP